MLCQVPSSGRPPATGSVTDGDTMPGAEQIDVCEFELAIAGLQAPEMV